jgi:uncharacterized membrane protein YccC
MIAWFQRHRPAVSLALRSVVACFVTFLVGRIFGMPQSLWAVLTSIIVMQGSVGASLKAMVDRMLGTLGGGVGGIIVSAALHDIGDWSPGIALLVGVPPLALLAAMRPAYRVAPITFLILVLSPNIADMGLIRSAVERLLEIMLGSGIALAVALFVMPARAQDALAGAVGAALKAMADLARELPQGLAGSADVAAIQAGHDRIRAAIAKAEVAADEALRERASFLAPHHDPLPICRTLRRLRHDFAILGRTMTAPLPETVRPLLTPAIGGLCEALGAFFDEAGASFAKRAAPPAFETLDHAFAAEGQALATARREGLTRALADEELERIFGLGFALGQIRRDLRDLAARGGEMERK